MKFKGQTVKGPKRQYQLRQQLGQGGFSVIYSTSDPDTICKVQVLSNPQILNAYKSQKQALQELHHKNIVLLKDCFQIKQKQGSYGFLFMENCSNGNAWNVLDGYGQNDVPEKLVLKISYYVASALEYIHKKQTAHRDIKLQNVLVTSKGEYKLCDFGSSSKETIRTVTKQNRGDLQQDIQKTTTPLYRSPQQLNLYSGFQIGPKVDIFALGVLMFMLCFKKQPFQSRLSAINKQFFIPEQTSYSSELVQLIQKCFATNPAQRITAAQVKKQISHLMAKKVAQIDINIDKQLDSTLSQILKINNHMLKKSTQVAQTSIFDKIKRIYNQMTTQTEGWIASFVEDNQTAPQLKYNRSIISKCWQKRYKVQKLYEILWRYSQDCKSKSLVNIKLLILLHNFLRKGPPESINYDGINSTNKLCTRIYRNWKMAQKPTDSLDIKRNSYICLIIRYYSLILTAKWKICYQNSDLMQGNFSILPFFKSKKEIPLLKLDLITQMIKFLETCVQFHQILATHSYLVDIQRSIILSLVDEEYCCISLLVFLICGFKEAICHLNQQLDIQKLVQKLKIVQKDFQDLFKKLSKLFQSANKLAALFQDDTPFLLSNKILERIKGINIREKKSGNFEFKKHINYERSIDGLKIPVTYEQAIKNPNFLKNLQKKDDQNFVQMNQFKINKNIGYNQNNQEPLNIQTLPQSSGSAVNEPFKKNKENKVFTNEQSPSKNGKQKIANSTQGNSKSKQLADIKNLKNANLMQFTHQNLNKDMKSQNKKQTQQKPQNNQFGDFLSIVDQKFNKSNNTFKEDQPINNQPVTFAKSPRNNDFFSSFNTPQSSNANDDSKSKISSVYTNTYMSKEDNNIFHQPFISVNPSKSISNFQAFQKLAQRRQKETGVNKNSPTNPKDQSYDRYIEPNHQDLRESISSVSKQLYYTLNRPSKQQDKKMQLMNFFGDDDDEQVPVKKVQNKQSPSSSKQIVFQVSQNHHNLLNRTGPVGFNQGHQKHGELLHNKSSKQIGKDKIHEQVFRRDNDKNFRTMPSEHNFIDLKGFIVEQVKKNAEQYFIEFPSLKFYNKVGFGHSSEVFRGQWRGRQVAIKRIKDNMSPSNAKQFRREIMTSVKIRHHPNLVTLIGIAQYKSEYYIINQFCNGATLFDFLHQSNHNIQIVTKITIAKQIAKGMLFLHTNDPPIIHRDLKSLNVLLVNKFSGEAQPQIKIADFGLSRDFASTYMTGTLGTYHWMAPEIFNNEPYSLKADVYSFGIVLWEILSRSPPYTNIKNPQSLMKFITLQNGRPELSFICSDCPHQLRMLMIRCWDRFPENRPNFKQILQTLKNICVS